MQDRHEAIMNRLRQWFPGWIRASIVGLLCITLSLGLSGAWLDGSGSGSKANNRESRLPQGNAITDGKALLRYALPIDNASIRDLQRDIEDIKDELRAARRWGAIQGKLKTADRLISFRRADILASVNADKRDQADDLLTQIKETIVAMQTSVEAKDKEQLWLLRGDVLNKVGTIEEWMIPDGAIALSIPSEYDHLPRLQGRATVEIVTNKGSLTVMVDGYNAPINAGNFIDLVQRGFYDGLEFSRADESYFLQTGDPPGKAVGFVDPVTGDYRAVPLEIRLRGIDEPVYGLTLEDAGLYREQPVLPFSSYGTVATARPANDPNGGSSQVFFFLFEPELTPAGLNFMDGRYSVFGYTVEGKETLGQLQLGDRIETARVVAGAENLIQPQGA